jgi:hypothetical protein
MTKPTLAEVQERLPPFNVTVQGATNLKRVIDMWTDINGEIDNYNLREDENEYYTHWQPKPAPPKD